MSSTARHYPPPLAGSQSLPPMKSRGNDRKHSKIKTEPLRLLGCPFRKRYPLGFNIRDAQQCCEGFANVPDVVDHLRSFHDCLKDGIPHLSSALGRSETESQWSLVYKAVFPDNDNPPSPYHCKVVEHLEYYRIQNSCLVMFADHLQETIDTQQLKLDPVDYIMETLQKFVNVTFHFSTQHGLNLLEPSSTTVKKGTASSFGNFVKKEPKQEDDKKPEYSSLSNAKVSSRSKTDVAWEQTTVCERSEFATMDDEGEEESSGLLLAKVGSKSKTDVVVKKEPAEAPQRNWKDVVGLTKRGNATGPKVPESPSTTHNPVEVIDLTGVEPSVFSANSALGLKDEGGVVQSKDPPTDSSARAEHDGEAQSPDDCVPEWQLREILNYSCHSVLGADLDSIANSRLLYDTLIDLADDFVIDLTEAAASCNEAAGSEGRNGGVNNPSGPSGSSPGMFLSSREPRGGQKGQRGDDENGDSRQGLSKEPPAGPAKARRREIRLPCPFRMMFPRTFNVRSHYSCSMTYFPTIGRLKDHLREYHKRQDGAEVLCTRCFAGFKSKDELHRHSRAVPGCDPAEFDPIAGLHGEAVNLLRGREKAGQDYKEQWKEICKIVFQNDQTVPTPEYHAVMEHFEFAEEFFRFFGELSRHLNPSVSAEEEQVASNFGLNAADSLFAWYHLGLDNYQPWSQIAETIRSEDIRCKDFKVIAVYCIKTLQRLAEISWVTRYENDGSRGNGGRRPRRREPTPTNRLPTPALSQGPSSVPNNSPLIFTDHEGDRPPKRRRIAPIPAPAPPRLVLTPREDASAPCRHLGTHATQGAGLGHLYPLTTRAATTPIFSPGVPDAGNVEMNIMNGSTLPSHGGLATVSDPTANLFLPSPDENRQVPATLSEPWDGTYWLQDLPEFLTKLDRQNTPIE